jgi:hypothetical protein
MANTVVYDNVLTSIERLLRSNVSHDYFRAQLCEYSAFSPRRIAPPPLFLRTTFISLHVALHGLVSEDYRLDPLVSIISRKPAAL